MHTHRNSVLALGVAIAALGISEAAMAAGTASPHAKVGHTHIVRTAGDEVFSAGRSDTFTLRFAQPDITVHAGDTVTLVHGDRTHDPHSSAATDSTTAVRERVVGDCRSQLVGCLLLAERTVGGKRSELPLGARSTRL